MSEAVVINNLTKRYGSLVAVDGVSFSVAREEVFGLLGPNGAGKTTTVEMIEGLRKPDSGTITVEGIDALKEIARIKEIIGVQLQSTTLHDQIKVREVLELFGKYYRNSLPASRLMEEFGLTDKQNSYIKSLSGGQKQRVALALALVNDPLILFLDEPTTGLDPQARRNVWDTVEELRRSGKTVILTTHYMEEAEALCNRVGIMDHGRIIAIGTPAQLVREIGLDSAVVFTCQPRQAQIILENVTGITRSTENKGTYTVFTSPPSATLQEIASIANQNEIVLEGLTLKRANLEDVFITLTGRNLRD